MAILASTEASSSAADGLPPVPVAVNRKSSYNFAVLTRQVFTKVTGQYVDFPANMTTDIITNVLCLPSTLSPLTAVSDATTDVGRSSYDSSRRNFLRKRLSGL